ncbi:MAG: hypothetical protein RR847_05340 [Bacilli bacterium]
MENKELLQCIYDDSKMGVANLTALLNTIKHKDNKITNTIEDILKKYESFIKDSEKSFKKHSEIPKVYKTMAKVGAFMGIKIELSKDNSDSRVANMLIQGLTMGSININKNLEKFNKADKKILNLGNNLKTFQEQSIEQLKKYL